MFNGNWALLPSWTSGTPVFPFFRLGKRTCGDPHEARQYPLHSGESWCPTGNIANTAIRTAAKNAKSSPAIARLKKKHSAHAHCRCQARAMYRAARSAALCWARYPNLSEGVQNAASNCILVGNAHISTLPAALSVRSRFQNGFREKTSAISARFTRSAFAWKKRLLPQLRRVPWMPAQHSRIYSRNNARRRRTGFFACAWTLVLMGSSYHRSLPALPRAAYNFHTPARIRG